MAIRLLRTYEVKCDRCQTLLSEFRAFTSSSENKIVENLISLCIKDCKELKPN